MNLKNIIASLVFLTTMVPRVLFADVYTYQTNVAYAESGKLRANQQILRVSFSPSEERYMKEIQNQTYNISWTLTFHLGSKTGDKIICQLSDRKIEGCSITPLGMGGYNWSGSTDFVLKSKKDGWFEISIDPISDQTAWLKAETIEGLSLSTMSVEQWVTSEDGFGVVHSSIPVLANRSGNGKPIAVCGSSSVFNERSSGLLSSGPIEGDWIPVSCLAPNCYDANDPSVEDEEEMRKLRELPECPKGWIRWRAQDGTLNIVPQSFFPAIKDPDNLQVKADRGWVYIRSGNYKDGIPLLMDAPYEPSAISELLFPDAADSIERRQLYLKTIDAFNSNFDDNKLVLGHIFVHHLSREVIIDQDLILQLKLLANQTQSPIVYDALGRLSYSPNGQIDWKHQVQYAEAAIRRINDLGLQVKDALHLSHFYYNSACGYSATKDYEKAALRLKEAFSINGSLRSWSLYDPDLDNLRKHLGIEEFRKLIGVAP